MDTLVSIDEVGLGRRLRIGDLARVSQKSARALRLYEGMGLLGSHRTVGGHRYYSEHALTRLTWIDKLQALGFSLPRIRELLDALQGANTGPEAMDRIREIYEEKLAETRAQVEILQTLAGELEDSLRYLDGCQVCDPGHVLNACAACDQPHAVDPPTLILGIHRQGEGPEGVAGSEAFAGPEASLGSGESEESGDS
ncbi:MAG: MerR family transcriptional regulator [Deltaproteobacteria bacterium]|nr:MerR family transcriptional regulator [Deltaproteobacteria bacterium]